MEQNERWTIYFSGHVQGVGFRFTVVDAAEEFPEVAGFVRNLRDGRVELVAEGPPQKLDLFCKTVQQRMEAYIHSVEMRQESATGEFSGFHIAR